MKKLKALFSAAVLACCSMMFAAQSQAAIISQSVYVGGLEIISYDLELDNSLINSGMGAISTYDGLAFNLVDFYIPLADGWNPVMNDFEAVIDVDNIFAGVEFLYVDAEDDFPWYYSVYYDAFSTIDNYVAIFFAGDYQLEAFEDDVMVVNSVSLSEPSVLALFALAFGGLMVRRRRA